MFPLIINSWFELLGWFVAIWIVIGVPAACVFYWVVCKHPGWIFKGW